MAEELSRGELEDNIREKAYMDPAYRKTLVEDPKQVLANEMGQELPSQLQVKVVEEEKNVIFLVVPRKLSGAGDELSEGDLEKVAGGILDTFNTECHAGGVKMAMTSQINVNVGGL